MKFSKHNYKHDNFYAYVHLEWMAVSLGNKVINGRWFQPQILPITEPSSPISSFWEGWKQPQKAEKFKAHALFPGSHPATAQKNFSYNLPFKFLLWDTLHKPQALKASETSEWSLSFKLKAGSWEANALTEFLQTCQRKPCLSGR